MINGGAAQFILVVENIKSPTTGQMFLKQRKYIEDFLEKIGLENLKPISTPWEVGMKFTKNDDTDGLTDKLKYQAAIGCLTYLMNATRPDITAAVNVLSQFVNCPNQQHWPGVKRILRYISGARDHGLVFNRGNTKVEAFSDSDYGRCPDTYCSRSGFCVRIGNAAFS